jgi:hypothetical protein
VFRACNYDDFFSWINVIIRRRSFRVVPSPYRCCACIYDGNCDPIVYEYSRFIGKPILNETRRRLRPIMPPATTVETRPTIIVIAEAWLSIQPIRVICRIFLTTKKIITVRLWNPCIFRFKKNWLIIWTILITNLIIFTNTCIKPSGIILISGLRPRYPLSNPSVKKRRFCRRSGVGVEYEYGYGYGYQYFGEYTKHYAIWRDCWFDTFGVVDIDMDDIDIDEDADIDSERTTRFRHNRFPKRIPPKL